MNSTNTLLTILDWGGTAMLQTRLSWLLAQFLLLLQSSSMVTFVRDYATQTAYNEINFNIQEC